MLSPVRLALIALLFAFGAPAAAQAPVSPGDAPVFYDLRFPDAVAGFTRGQVIDFEKDQPGLGYDVKYSGRGWIIDVFIYDAGLKDIPDSPLSDLVRRQFIQARGDIIRGRQRNPNDTIEEKETFQISTPDKTVRFVCGSFLIASDGRQLDSYLCLTAWKGKFVKYRLTTLHRDGAGAGAVAERFVSGWVDVLWPEFRTGPWNQQRLLLGQVFQYRLAQQRCPFDMSGEQDAKITAYMTRQAQKLGLAEQDLQRYFDSLRANFERRQSEACAADSTFARSYRDFVTTVLPALGP